MIKEIVIVILIIFLCFFSPRNQTHVIRVKLNNYLSSIVWFIIIIIIIKIAFRPCHMCVLYFLCLFWSVVWVYFCCFYL